MGFNEIAAREMRAAGVAPQTLHAGQTLRAGHGIGGEMHEPPEMLHFGRPQTGLVLREGMVFTIEQMLN